MMTETFGEKELRLRRESAQRLRVLVVVVVLSVVARLIISDPVKPPPPDHSGVPIKILPGMLAALPVSERAKLDPQLIARMMAADEEIRLKKPSAVQAPKVELAYKAADKPDSDDPLGEREKHRKYNLAMRQKAVDLAHAKMEQEKNAPMKTLVRFTNGGALRVEDAHKAKDSLTIRLVGIAATFPAAMVRSTSTNPADFTEPVPAGMVRIQPAHGITVTIAEGTAKRISISKSTYDQI